ncbi:PREDICTED: uncharacterized protein LOC106297189 isoform X2 [Brassica oleracea var. oleracea]|uniref:uncharacterized protein LOC106297189 isoform X2 n=1 Tax=Brassica oleracea var. oleracea TaxID=109376 RepID=UPI0006A72EAE|nr:PREDICTED: uncharacterized protein LOC106297189 isoform X2 [Brassica oleracea var. oleracea]
MYMDVTKVEAYLDRYEEEIPHQISGCNSVQDMIDVMPLVSLVTSRYELARIKTGWKDIDVENRLRKLDSVGTDLIEWAATHMNPMSLVMIFFNHGIVSVNTIASTRNVRRVHALALTTGMLEDEWNRSRLMGLYLQASTCTLVDCERLFHGAEKKGLLLFNQMLTVYSRHDPDKAKRLFDELIGTCPPDGATYMGLLHALSVGGEPWEAIKVIQQMESRGVQPDPRHYGVAVDSFAHQISSRQLSIFSNTFHLQSMK